MAQQHSKKQPTGRGNITRPAGQSHGPECAGVSAGHAIGAHQVAREKRPSHAAKGEGTAGREIGHSVSLWLDSHAPGAQQNHPAVLHAADCGGHHLRAGLVLPVRAGLAQVQRAHGFGGGVPQTLATHADAFAGFSAVASIAANSRTARSRLGAVESPRAIRVKLL